LNGVGAALEVNQPGAAIRIRRGDAKMRLHAPFNAHYSVNG
jgi:hypothetical protein